MSRNVLYRRCRRVVPSHCLHSTALWVWALWKQRRLDHHPGWSAAPSPLLDASTWIVTGFFVLKYLSVVSSHTNDLSLSNATWYMAFQLYSTSVFRSPLSVAVWEDSCGMNGERYVTCTCTCYMYLLPFQGSSEALLCSVGQASPWWRWPLMDLGGLCACHKHSRRTWQSCSWLHTSCSVPVHVLLWPSWTCVVSCHVLHHSYHVWWYHLQFQWLLHSDLGPGPSSSRRYSVHMRVQMEDVQSEISLCVCWRLSEEMIHSRELCNSRMKIPPPWWIFVLPASSWVISSNVGVL